MSVSTSKTVGLAKAKAYVFHTKKHKKEGN